MPPPADIEDRRLAIYRDLVFNNVSSLLAGNFPRLREALNKGHWDDLIRDFFVRHRARTPLFPQLAGEFLDFLQGPRAADPRDPPFLLELAHYEWVELVLEISEETPDLSRVDPDGDLLVGHPVVSPLAWNLTYRYPVHRLLPATAAEVTPGEPTHLVLYRTAEERVAVLEINAVTQALLIRLDEPPPRSGRALLEEIAAELGHPQPQQVIAFGAGLLADLRDRGVVLGTSR